MGGVGSGRLPKSAAAHREAGTFRSCRHLNDLASVVSPAEPKKPRGLGKLAAAHWNKVVGHHKGKGTLCELDAMFIQYASELWELYQEARKAAKKNPGDFHISSNVVKYGSMWKDAARLLGMTPVDRPRVKAEPTKKTTLPTRHR